MNLPPRFSCHSLFATACAVTVMLLAEQICNTYCSAQEANVGRCVVIELFTRADCEKCEAVEGILAGLQQRHTQTRLVKWDLDNNAKAVARLDAIRTAFKTENPQVPSVYLCRQLLNGFEEKETARQIEDMFTIHVYWREGCPHCAQGKKYLAELIRKYPMYSIELHEIVTDVAARRRFEELSREFHVQAPVVPTFHLFGQLVSGYIDEQTTGKRLENLVTGGLGACEKTTKPRPAIQHESRQQPWKGFGITKTSFLLPIATYLESENASPGEEELDLPPVVPVDEAETEADGISVPFFGRLSVRDMGLPAFTLAIGLIDGFNPCAMWVLLFLLSILVNLHDRQKIAIVAGTFVIISGLVYLAFMAAWLNVFLLIGYMRPAQIILGLLALFVGLVNIKDFFAFKWGFSLSIPDSAKPGIYARVRDIVNAKHLWLALTGAMVLAIVVNAVELLCSAGFPAMYTQILSQQDLPLWKNYGYLGLYISAYMFDDTVMLLIVVITLTKTKLQETGGRWLKLLSGIVILALGLMMLFAPTWLF